MGNTPSTPPPSRSSSRTPSTSTSSSRTPSTSSITTHLKNYISTHLPPTPNLLNLSKKELDDYCKPTSLYNASGGKVKWSEQKLRRLIGDGVLARRVEGVEFDGDDDDDDNDHEIDHNDGTIDLATSMKLKQNKNPECPICFLTYTPLTINYTQCCEKPICTECYLQIRPEVVNNLDVVGKDKGGFVVNYDYFGSAPSSSTGPSTSADITNVDYKDNCVGSCPFCNQGNFEAEMVDYFNQRNLVKSPSSSRSISTAKENNVGSSSRNVSSEGNGNVRKLSTNGYFYDDNVSSPAFVARVQSKPLDIKESTSPSVSSSNPAPINYSVNSQTSSSLTLEGYDSPSTSSSIGSIDDTSSYGSSMSSYLQSRIKQREVSITNEDDVEDMQVQVNSDRSLLISNYDDNNDDDADNTISSSSSPSLSTNLPPHPPSTTTTTANSALMTMTIEDRRELEQKMSLQFPKFIPPPRRPSSSNAVRESKYTVAQLYEILRSGGVMPRLRSAADEDVLMEAVIMFSSGEGEGRGEGGAGAAEAAEEEIGESEDDEEDEWQLRRAMEISLAIGDGDGDNGRVEESEGEEREDDDADDAEYHNEQHHEDEEDQLEHYDQDGDVDVRRHSGSESLRSSLTASATTTRTGQGDDEEYTITGGGGVVTRIQDDD